MNEKVRNTLLASCLCLTVWFASEPAQALTPPLPEAKIVYSNGGRILTMNADGTDRKVIFGKNRNPKNDLVGGTEPVSSPDGATVAFSYKLPGG